MDFHWGSAIPFASEDGPVGLSFDLPAGTYRAEWVNTRTGDVDKEERFQNGGGSRTLTSPAYAAVIALRFKRRW